MGFDYNTRVNVAFYMAIVLIVFQLITFFALLILWKTFRELKHNVQKYKDSLPLVNITTSSSPAPSQPVTSPPVSSLPVSSLPVSLPSPPSPKNLYPSRRSNPSNVRGNKQKPEKNEVIDVLATPNPNRRPFAHTTVAIVTSHKKESIGKNRGFSFTSFTDFKRDSGIGSSTGRNQSTASESMKDVIASTRDSIPVFSEKEPVDEETRTLSNASRTSQASRVSLLDYKLAMSPYVNISINDDDNNDDDDDDDDGHFALQRLQTMAIEQIDVDTAPSAREKRKRLSQLLTEKYTEEAMEKGAAFTNRGYSDASVTSQRRAPLASEECSIASDLPHNLDENSNVLIEEHYENQEAIEKHRLSMELDSCKL